MKNSKTRHKREIWKRSGKHHERKGRATEYPREMEKHCTREPRSSPEHPGLLREKIEKRQHQNNKTIRRTESTQQQAKHRKRPTEKRRDKEDVKQQTKRNPPTESRRREQEDHRTDRRN